jgi:hypothetical protein
MIAWAYQESVLSGFQKCQLCFRSNEGFIFLRRILEPQESLWMVTHRILKQNRSTCNGNIMDLPLQEMLDTTVGWKVHDHGVLGF